MTFRRDHGLYDTKKLWILSKNNKIVQYPTSKLEHFLDLWLWFTGTPNQVLSGEKEDDERHFERIEQADLSYPILLSKIYQPNASIEIPGKVDLVDGLHRLAKAIKIEKRETIPVVFVTREQLDLARISDPRKIKKDVSERTMLLKEVIDLIINSGNKIIIE